ncbi:carbamoyltransferase HypF [Shimia sp.]|uniref:carbamoyltransferase HypF n=1 Tax=Shimia sp. TaxID=1954381 RepID=UPI003568D7D8
MTGPDSQGWQVRVRGLVQGVGFRPTVWRLAKEAGLQGEVLNDGEGVLIRLTCPERELRRFLDALQRNAPPLSRIDAMETRPLRFRPEGDGFAIVASRDGAVRTGIVPDAATCGPCRDDIADPANRRAGYAFTNCTNCGPRLSITGAIPYDRANTSMAPFAMCPDCLGEYRDPADRRFHAQPNACPVCGPRLALLDARGNALEGDPLQAAAALLGDGKIVAIKGLGGFQLACDARSEQAVQILRQRKRRPAKPFALMGRDAEQVARYVHLEPAARAELEGPAAPIVLAPARDDAALAPAVAPGQNRLGFMLAHTPLHHLLMQGRDMPLVMTSGNLSGEPQVIANDAALSRLSGIADAFLMHDRDIVNRLDDSVIQLVDGAPVSLRRARGLAPAPLQLHAGFAGAPQTLAVGADLKNTFCLLKGGQAIVSQHVGDMENARCHRDFRANLALYQDIYDLAPERIAVDAHPGYFSTRMGQEIAADCGARLVSVQHHHAHVAAALAEQGAGPEAGPVLGVVLDGLGHGTDGTIWGGEILLADFHEARRLAHFLPVALPGGDKANRQPWRNTLAHLLAAFGTDALSQLEGTHGALPVLEALRARPVAALSRVIESGLNTPLSSSAGRLFDAVAAALGLCFDAITYEGQAAMELQALAESEPGPAAPYPFEDGTVIGWAGLWRGILGDMASGQSRSAIAARFHATVAASVSGAALRLAREHDLKSVVLTGGVFQNRLLLSLARDQLESGGLAVLVPQRYPANDGGLSLGQATIAAARRK